MAALAKHRHARSRFGLRPSHDHACNTWSNRGESLLAKPPKTAGVKSQQLGSNVDSADGSSVMSGISSYTEGKSPVESHGDFNKVLLVLGGQEAMSHQKFDHHCSSIRLESTL